MVLSRLPLNNASIQAKAPFLKVQFTVLEVASMAIKLAAAATANAIQYVAGEP